MEDCFLSVQLAFFREGVLHGFDRESFELPGACRAWALSPGTPVAAVLRDNGEIWRFDRDRFVKFSYVPLPRHGEVAISANGEAVVVSSRELALLAIFRQNADDPSTTLDCPLPTHPERGGFHVVVSPSGEACGVHAWTYDNHYPERHLAERPEQLHVLEQVGKGLRRNVTPRQIVELGWLDEGPVLLTLTSVDTTAEWLDVSRTCAWEVVLDGAATQSSLSPCGSVLACVVEGGACWVADRRTKRIRRIARDAIAAHARLPNRVRWLDRHRRAHEHVVLPGIPADLEPLLYDPEGRQVLEDWALENGPPALARALTYRGRRKR